MNRKHSFVSAAVVLTAIILSISCVSPANAFWPFSGKKKAKPVRVVHHVAPDTVHVDQYGNVLYTKSSNAIQSSQLATSNANYSYNHETKAQEGGWALTTDARREWGNDGKPSGTSVGVGLAVGKYSASVRSDGSGSYSQDPNAPYYMGNPNNTYGYNGYYGNAGYAVPTVQCIFRLQEGTQTVSVELFDPNGQRMDIIRLGLQGGAFYPSKVMYLPPGRYTLRREGCGPIEWVVPVGQRQVVRDIG